MTETPPSGLTIYLIAGEPSGDLLAGRLMAALRWSACGPVTFRGVGGEAMIREGLTSLFPMSELSVMGIAEVLPRAAGLLRRMRDVADDIRRVGPDAVVTVDAPAFCLGVLRRLGDFPTARIHYVAPTVWAWRPGRVHKFARLLDHLMALLPFEPPLFERAGLPATFVGHAVVESGIDRADGERFRACHHTGGGPLLCVLPGSRMGEVGHHLPPFRQAVDRLRARHPGLAVVVPTVPGVSALVRAEIADWDVPAAVVEGDAERFAAMAASDAALAASGTVALELAMARTPSVVAYRVHPVTYRIVRFLVRVRYANLVNILLDRPAIPECLQAACRGDVLAAELDRLLMDPNAGAAQVAAYDDAMAMLTVGEEKPSEAAARCVLDVIAARRRS